MADLSRRSLLFGALAGAVVASIPSIVQAALAPVYSNLPVLYGDGIHDDAPAIQAIVDHKPVMLVDGRVYLNDGPIPVLPAGEYVINQTITITVRGGDYNLIAPGATIHSGPGLPYMDPMIRVPYCGEDPWVMDLGGLGIFDLRHGDGAHIGPRDWTGLPAAGWEPPTRLATAASYHDLDDGFTTHYSDYVGWNT